MTLVDACRRFVALKYRVDDFLDSMWQRFGDYEAVYTCGLEWLVDVGQDTELDDEAWIASRFPDFYNMETVEYTLRYSLSPVHFVQAAFPFYTFKGYSEAALRLSDIDPSVTIGGSYSRRWPESLSEAELARINEKSSNSEPPGYDSAYSTPGRLPLYIGHEGKNRVRAFINADRDIRSYSCQDNFPAATALMLHGIEQPASIYVRDSPTYVITDVAAETRYVLPLPAVTIPILESYGVPWGAPLERGYRGGQFVWRWQEERRKVLYSLVGDFMRP